MSKCNFPIILPFIFPPLPIPAIALPIPDILFDFEFPSFFCPLD